jgi:hypothetical protein
MSGRINGSVESLESTDRNAFMSSGLMAPRWYKRVVWKNVRDRDWLKPGGGWGSICQAFWGIYFPLTEKSI